MLDTIVNSILDSFDACFGWLMAFDIDGLFFSFILSFVTFAMIYRFLLRPFFYGGVSDTVSKKKTKKR